MFQFRKFDEQVLPKMDVITDTIMLGIRDGKSLVEIAEETGRSFSGIRKIAKKLERDKGYIVYVPHKSRSGGRYLTPKGEEYLRANGLVPQDSPFRK